MPACFPDCGPANTYFSTSSRSPWSSEAISPSTWAATRDLAISAGVAGRSWMASGLPSIQFLSAHVSLAGSHRVAARHASLSH